MQQRKILGAVVVLVLIVCGFAVWKLQTQTPASAPVTSGTDSTEWKTYTDSGTGFTIKYPSQYTVTADTESSTQWQSRRLLIIDDNPSLTSSKPRAIPVTVDVQKQPVVANGKVYHTIAEYQQSGTAALMMQNAPNPNGELEIVNGMQALVYHLPPAESTGIGGDSYFFVKDDLIYEVGINPNDPYAKEMLQTIGWK